MIGLDDDNLIFGSTPKKMIPNRPRGLRVR